MRSVESLKEVADYVLTLFCFPSQVGHLPEHFRVISGKHGLAWAECDQRILKSKNDSRDYKLIRLNNAMEVMLVVWAFSLLEACLQALG